jgi:hypothetical protein
MKIRSHDAVRAGNFWSQDAGDRVRRVTNFSTRILHRDRDA